MQHLQLYHPEHKTSPGMNKHLSHHLKYISVKDITTDNMYVKLAIRPLVYALFEAQESMVTKLFNIQIIGGKKLEQIPIFGSQYNTNSMLFWLSGRLSEMDSWITQKIYKRDQLAFQKYRKFWKHVVNQLAADPYSSNGLQEFGYQYEDCPYNQVVSLVSKAVELLSVQLQRGRTCLRVKATRSDDVRMTLTWHIWGLLDWIQLHPLCELSVTHTVIGDGLESYFQIRA